MRRPTSYFFLIVAMVMSLTGCSDNDKPDFYNGTGSLSLSVIAVIDPSITVVPGRIPDPSDFSITLTSADGSMTHTWKSLDDFTQGTRFLSGDYVVTATYGPLRETDSWHTPCMSATENIHISEGENLSVTLRAALSSGVVSLTRTDAYTARFGDNGITLHPVGAGYFEFGTESDDSGSVFVSPGEATLSMVTEGIDGPLSFLLTRDIEVVEGDMTEITVDYIEETATVVVESVTAGTAPVHDETVFRPEMLRGSGPSVAVSCKGYTQVEHALPEEPMVFTVTHETELSSVMLTIESEALAATGAPVECDLMNLTDTERNYFMSHGVVLPTRFDGEISIDMTPIFASLGYNDNGNNRSLFAVAAVDRMSRMNTSPAMSVVVTLPVDLRIENVMPIVIGLNRTSMTVVSPSGDPLPYLKLVGDGSLLEITGSEVLGDGRYRISFIVDEATTPMKLEVFYDGMLKETLSVARVSPEFDLEVDAFATLAIIRISAADADLKSVIVDNLKILVNDKRAVVYKRPEERYDLIVSGLAPSSAYTLIAGLKGDLTTDPDSKIVRIVTEAAKAIPNGDFEDVKNTIKYKDMPSGGAYSQTFAEIFNNQNHTSYDYWTPTKWANTNIKTFNGGSRRKNTWYMQPSVIATNEAASGDFAVDLISVAFDPDGAEIAPYLQESLPYTDYSRNIPQIAYRAAGRLFLGSYDYNVLTQTETYTEGIPFGSRPLTLSGFYRYQPSPVDFNDKGRVEVEVIGFVDGKETVIASSSERLTAVAGSGYAAFKVALDYKYFGVKATRLKVMFSSSDCEASIQTETAQVKTCDDPSTSTSTGSRLRIDNITLAY